MKTLTSSYSNIYVDKHNGFSCWRDFVLDGPQSQICFSPSRMVTNVRFLRLVALQHEAIHPVASVSSESQAELETAENQIQEEYQSKTVHVKFQLQKKCSFGEKFLIVGDDPMFGLWDPADAVPLNWSDGHLWTVEMDIPVGKSIHFKFILKGNTGNILWQPGRDRIFQAWETKNKIIVCEDWENELQKIIEEESFITQKDDQTFNSKMLIMAENLTQPEENPPPNINDGSVNADSNTYSEEKPLPETYKEQVVSDNNTPLQLKPNINYPKENRAVNVHNKVIGEKRFINANKESIVVSEKVIMIAENLLGSNGKHAPTNNSASKNVEGNLITYEGDAVLAPGLTPLSTISTEEAIVNEGKRKPNNGSMGINEAKGYIMPEKPKNIELDDKQEADSDPHHEETIRMFNDEKEQFENKLEQNTYLGMEEEQPNLEPVNNDILQNDIQWVQKTLQKLQTNLRLL